MCKILFPPGLSGISGLPAGLVSCLPLPCRQEIGRALTLLASLDRERVNSEVMTYLCPHCSNSIALQNLVLAISPMWLEK